MSPRGWGHMARRGPGARAGLCGSHPTPFGPRGVWPWQGHPFISGSCPRQMGKGRPPSCWGDLVGGSFCPDKGRWGLLDMGKEMDRDTGHWGACDRGGQVGLQPSPDLCPQQAHSIQGHSDSHPGPNPWRGPLGLRPELGASGRPGPGYMQVTALTYLTWALGTGLAIHSQPRGDTWGLGHHTGVSVSAAQTASWPGLQRKSANSLQNLHGRQRSSDIRIN